jgi:hypothetical protein
LITNNLQIEVKKACNRLPWMLPLGMNEKEKLAAKITELRKALKSSADLTPGDRISILNQIGDLQDKLNLLSFHVVDDIDYGYHDQFDM